MRCLVFGGRENADPVLAAYWLEHYRSQITVEIDGEAPGYDSLGKAWAEFNGVPREGYPILPEERRIHGNRAGNRRNQRMLEASRPDMAIEFPGRSGTWDMRQRLLAVGISPIRCHRLPADYRRDVR